MEEPTPEFLARELAMLARNLEITDEIARHAATAASVHAAHLVVLGRLLARLLSAADIAAVRADLARTLPPGLLSPALSVLAAIESGGKGG